ncbi:hypothetical protein M885DRAFT_575369 [Pelagophyceae sp. CCMP2097]|nr:hypothetical protein M885DRAFT_575369 [Pelagophyceae sp. CCMP2097]
MSWSGGVVARADCARGLRAPGDASLDGAALLSTGAPGDASLDGAALSTGPGDASGAARASNNDPVVLRRSEPWRELGANDTCLNEKKFHTEEPLEIYKYAYTVRAYSRELDP